MSGSNFHLTLEPHPPSYYFRSQISPETKKHVLCVSVCHGARLVFLNRFCAHSQTSEITKLSRPQVRPQVPGSTLRSTTIHTLFVPDQLVRFKEIACSVITPTPTSPSNFPTASLGVPPIGWVACSVTNLSLCSVLGYKPLSLSFRRPPQRIPILSPWRPTPLLNT